MAESHGQGTASTINVVVRALTVLNVVAKAPAGLTLKQLHERLGIPWASLHRLLSTLESERYVSRSPTSLRYSIGPTAAELGQRTQAQNNVLVPPQPMVDLATQTGRTVFITQLIDGEVICVSLIESKHHLRLFVRIGQQMPLHAAASARAILAYREPDFVEGLLDRVVRKPFTSVTPRAINEVIDRLDVIRHSGFDVCDSELDDGVWAVSAPIFGATGRADCAITVAFAASHVTSDAMRADQVRAVMRAANRISDSFGSDHPIQEWGRGELEERFAEHGAGHPMSDSIHAAPVRPVLTDSTLMTTERNIS